MIRANLRHGRSETVVSDILGGAGIATLKEIAARHRGRYMAAWFAPGTPERKAAGRAHMFSIPGIKGLRLVANPLTKLDINIHDLASWDLSIGDLELL